MRRKILSPLLHLNPFMKRDEKEANSMVRKKIDRNKLKMMSKHQANKLSIKKCNVNLIGIIFLQGFLRKKYMLSEWVIYDFLIDFLD